jgi:hypothetical protein
MLASITQDEERRENKQAKEKVHTKECISFTYMTTT